MASQRGRKSPTSKGTQAPGGATCAECRRLKIRCDRKVPCGQCTRRSCASICPDGQLVPAHGNGSNRLLGQVPANIDAISRRLDLFSERIRELEGALQAAHARTEQSPHPLLADDLVRLSKEADQEMEEEPTSNAVGTEETTTLSFGSLLPNSEGGTRYLGPGAASSWILHNEFKTSPDFEQAISIPTTLLSPTSLSQLRSQIEAYIPNEDGLRGFCHSYFKYSLSLFQPLTPSFMTQLISTPIRQLTTSRLGLLLIVMGLAAQLDPHRPANWLQPSLYFTLSRTCLVLEDVSINVSLELVEVIGLQALFLLHHDATAVPERSWIAVGQAMKYAQAMGLHRDSKHWKLTEESAQRRRRTFYELWTFDIFLSAHLGRPPSLNRFQVDCEMPMDDLTSLGENPYFYRWKHQFGSTILLELATTALSSSQVPGYAFIISLDKQLRATPLPEKFTSNPCMAVDTDNYPQFSLRLQEHEVHLIQQYTLIILHRPFFARALLDSKNDLFKHRFLRSVMTVHDSSRNIVRHILWLAHNEPASLRSLTHWPLYMMCSLVSLGALVVKEPLCTLAAAAFQSLEEGCNYLSGLDKTSPATKQVLQRLYTSAKRSLHQEEGQASSPGYHPHNGRLSLSVSSQAPSPHRMEGVVFSSPSPSLSISSAVSPNSAHSRVPSINTPRDLSQTLQTPTQWVFDDTMRVESQNDRAGPLHHTLYTNTPPYRSPIATFSPQETVQSGSSPTTHNIPGFHSTTPSDTFDSQSWSHFLSSIGL